MGARYRFGEFVVSPRHRILLRGGDEVPLIPRYLDLLLLLVERRHEAIHRREIMDRVWSDVVVSDGALSQAVRTLRRALGDVSREPSYIRTVSRHGYQFVHVSVAEEPDEGPLVSAPLRSAADALESGDDPFEAPLALLLSDAPEEERREAAETLHALGTDEAVRRLDRQGGGPAARALLRDARWDVAHAGAVPLLGRPGGSAATLVLIGLRLRRAAALARGRWASSALGGAVAGAIGGLLGGGLLCATPDGPVSKTVLVPLLVVGAAIGGVGAAGVGAGLAAAEALARSMRGVALVALGALGGGAVGALAHTLGRLTLEGVFGRDLSAVGGGFEGFVIGAAAGLGYALSTPRPGGGMAAPSGPARFRVVLTTAACCCLACIVLSRTGGRLGGASLDVMARSFQGSQVGLAPLAHLLGEADLGPRARTLFAAYEGLLFGAGLAFGLTRRPR